MRVLTGEADDDAPETGKNKAAQELGRAGGNTVGRMDAPPGSQFLSGGAVHGYWPWTPPQFACPWYPTSAGRATLSRFAGHGRHARMSAYGRSRDADAKVA